MVREFKVKWWNAFEAYGRSNKAAVQTYLNGQGINFNAENSFLAEKSPFGSLFSLCIHLNGEEYFAIVKEQEQQLNEEISSSSTSSSASVSAVNLGDENKDGCFGILPSAPHLTNKSSFSKFKSKKNLIYELKLLYLFQTKNFH